MTLVFESNKTTSKCTTLKICVKTAIIIKEIPTYVQLRKHNGINPLSDRDRVGVVVKEKSYYEEICDKNGFPK